MIRTMKRKGSFHTYCSMQVYEGYIVCFVYSNTKTTMGRREELPYDVNRSLQTPASLQPIDAVACQRGDMGEAGVAETKSGRTTEHNGAMREEGRQGSR